MTLLQLSKTQLACVAFLLLIPKHLRHIMREILESHFDLKVKEIDFDTLGSCVIVVFIGGKQIMLKNSELTPEKLVQLQQLIGCRRFSFTDLANKPIKTIPLSSPNDITCLNLHT